MSTQLTADDINCDVCARTFQVEKLFFQHGLETGHRIYPYCAPCKRRFKSWNALQAHQAESRAHKNSSYAPSNSENELHVKDQEEQVPEAVASSQIASKAGNTSPLCATQIPKDCHLQILLALWSHCHTLGTLQRHFYSFNYATSPSNIPTADQTAPDPSTRAVVVDVQMAGMKAKDLKAVSLSAVDFITGEEIVEFSPFKDWQAAKAELLKHVDDETILVGHFLRHDLDIIRVQHNKIVDSAIITSDAMFGSEGKPRYKNTTLARLCNELLEPQKRDGSSSALRLIEGQSHDGRYHALAKRELVLWCVQNEEALGTWAEKKRTGFQEREDKRREAKKAKATKKKAGRKNRTYGYLYYHEFDSDAYWEEMNAPTWRDYVPWEVWPKSPPDSD